MSVFVDQAAWTGTAMERHNGSAAVAGPFSIARPILDGPVTLATSAQIFAKG